MTCNGYSWENVKWIVTICPDLTKHIFLHPLSPHLFSPVLSQLTSGYYGFCWAVIIVGLSLDFRLFYASVQYFTKFDRYVIEIQDMSYSEFCSYKVGKASQIQIRPSCNTKTLLWKLDYDIVSQILLNVLTVSKTKAAESIQNIIVGWY